MKIVIIGGVAGGATAAARLRRLDENAEIIVIERSGFVSYANCGLPYFIGGEITERESLTLQTPESFLARFRIDIRINEEAISIDTKEKIISIRKVLTNEEYKESYDKLILAPGAAAIKPDVSGVDLDGVFTLRTVENTFEIDKFIDDKKIKTAVIVGGGFVGLEMAENLTNKGINVTLLQRSRYVMSMLDGDMAAILQNYIRTKGISLQTNAQLSAIEKKEAKLVVKVSEKEFITDMVVLAVGVVPESTLAKKAGLELGVKGAIKVDTHMQTSNVDIYAVGDVVETKHFVTGKPMIIPLAGPANKQGRIAADNICGIQSEYKGSQGSVIMKMFDMTVASTGINKKQADEEGMESDYVLLSSASHATYYPNAKNMFIKVLFEKKSGIILGAQIVGFAGVDKRIDVLATAIRARMSASDLEELDLAYAPPYSSAKDPVNMAGYVISNILTDRVNQIHWDDVDRLNENDFILDTRTTYEYDNGHIENAINIPVDNLRERVDELPIDKRIYVYCHSGLRSYIACRILMQKGYDVVNISGGYGIYSQIQKNRQVE